MIGQGPVILPPKDKVAQRRLEVVTAGSNYERLEIINDLGDVIACMNVNIANHDQCAAHIVHCVNMHEELIGALQLIVATRDSSKFWAIVVQVLAKATGGVK